MCTSKAALVKMANNKDPQMNEAPAYTEGTEEVGIKSPTSNVMWLTTPMPQGFRAANARVPPLMGANRVMASPSGKNDVQGSALSSEPEEGERTVDSTRYSERPEGSPDVWRNQVKRGLRLAWPSDMW